MSFQRRSIVDTLSLLGVYTSDGVLFLFSKSCHAPVPDFTPFQLKAALEQKALSLASGPRAISHQPENPQGTGLVSVMTFRALGAPRFTGTEGGAELEKKAPFSSTEVPCRSLAEHTLSPGASRSGTQGRLPWTSLLRHPVTRRARTSLRALSIGHSPPPYTHAPAPSWQRQCPAARV